LSFFLAGAVFLIFSSTNSLAYFTSGGSLAAACWGNSLQMSSFYEDELQTHYTPLLPAAQQKKYTRIDSFN